MALRALNSVGGFSIGETPEVVIAANGDISASAASFTGDVTSPNLTINLELSGNTANFTGNIQPLGILTDNYYYANGDPVDFQQPAGSNTQIQFNSDEDFGASNNFTFNTATDTLGVVGLVDVTGNANVSDTVTFGSLSDGTITIEQFDNDDTLAANSATRFATQQAVKSYVDTQISAEDLDFVGDSGTGNVDLDSENFTIAGGDNITTEASGQTLTVRLDDSITLGNVTATGDVVANEVDANTANIDDLTGITADFSGNVGFTGAKATITGDLDAATANFSGNVGALGVLTDNLYYANGTPWDLQEAAGNTGEIQFNSGDDFAASPNFTFDTATDTLTVTGDVDVSSNLTASEVDSNTANIDTLTGGTANFTGNVEADTFIGNFSGNISGNITVPGANTQIIFNDEGLANADAAFTFDKATDVLTVAGNIDVENADLGNLALANYVNVANNLDVAGDAVIDGNLTVDDIDANSATIDDLTSGTADFSGNVVLPNLTVNLELSGNTANFSGDVDFAGATVTVDNDLQGNTATFSGNVQLQGDEVTIDNDLQANTATFIGNISALNANLGNLATANFVNVSSNLNVTGNVNAGNLVGTLANGTSNVRIFNDANVEISSAGTANIVRISDSSVQVANVDFTVTNGDMLANGNITANTGFFIGANAQLTGEANVNSVLTANVTAPTGNIGINAAGSDSSILLTPTGSGTVDVNNFRITEVADPVNPLDATNKQYVDALGGEGLVIHTPVRVETESALTGTYAQGGTTPTVDSIASQSEITFSAAHGLSVNDGIVFDSTFNGLTGGEAYWVASVIDSDTITVKDDYFGSALTNLTNGNSLSQSSRANPGVGATLTNSGANAALTIDGVTLSTSDRVLLRVQSNGEENGIYTVTTVGDGSTAWVLTRATDFDTYIPGSSLGVAKNSYVLVNEGDTGAGESFVMTAPAGEVIVGTDALTFTQFSKAGTYTGEDGVDVTGTIISANVDGVTTAIVGGNIAVKASAELTTPNIGAATGTSLDVTGNVDAQVINVTSNGNIAGNLVVGDNSGGTLEVDGTISSNANVSGLNLTTSGNVVATGNLAGNNANVTTLLTVPTANVSNVVNAGNVSIDDDLQGNTATFSGNVVLPNLTVNLELAGNTANFSGNVVFSGDEVTIDDDLQGNTATFSGNISALNANLGNLATANFFTGTLIDGTSNIVIAPSGNITITADGNSSFVVTDTGANVSGNLGITDSVTANSYTANNDVKIGDTEIGHGTLTTSAITANQTIAEFAVTGTTGMEFIVKGEDSTGAKYSVATVTAVTDGTNVDFVTYATALLGSSTGTLTVNKVGSNIALQVTPSSSNSTVWTAQFKTV